MHEPTKSTSVDALIAAIKRTTELSNGHAAMEQLLDSLAQKYDALSDEVQSIRAATEAGKQTSSNIDFATDALRRLPVKSRAFVIADRVRSVTTSLAALRINSLSEHIQALEALSLDIENLSEKTELNLQVAAGKALPVLARIFDVLGSERGAQMLVAGAVAGIVGVAGWPATTVYSLSMAAWMGKDAFLEAVKSGNRQVSSRAKSKPKAAKPPSRKS